MLLPLTPGAPFETTLSSFPCKRSRAQLAGMQKDPRGGYFSLLANRLAEEPDGPAQYGGSCLPPRADRAASPSDRSGRRGGHARCSGTNSRHRPNCTLPRARQSNSNWRSECPSSLPPRLAKRPRRTAPLPVLNRDRGPSRRRGRGSHHEQKPAAPMQQMRQRWRLLKSQFSKA